MSLADTKINFFNVQFQKISILPPQRGLEISGGRGEEESQRPKHLSKFMKLDWNFQRGGGGGGLRKNPFCGGGMNNFWNHKICFFFKNY